MPRHIYQWILLAVWIAALVWSYFFSGGGRDVNGEFFDQLLKSATFMGPPSVDWTLIALFNFIGLSSFVILFLLVDQKPFRGKIWTKAVFFVLSIPFGSFALYPYLIFQSSKEPAKPLSKDVKEFAANPWVPAVILVLFALLLGTALLRGNPVTLLESIQNINVIQVMALDFLLYWLAAAVLVVGEFWAHRHEKILPVGSLFLVLLPIGGPLIYLIWKKLAAPRTK